MNRIFVILAGLVLVTMGVRTTEATVIDLFESGGGFDQRHATGPLVVNQDGLADVVGGARRIEVTNVGLAAEGKAVRFALGTTPGPDALVFEAVDTAAVYSTLTYGLNGDLNLDLSGDTHMSLLFDTLPGIGQFAVWSVELGLTSGGVTASRGLTSFQATSPNLLFDYSDPAFAGIDFGDIDRIEVELTSDFGPLTFELAEIRSIPEPASLTLLACGGAWLLRRRGARR